MLPEISPAFYPISFVTNNKAMLSGDKIWYIVISLLISLAK